MVISSLVGMGFKVTYVGRRALTASLSGVEWMLTRWPPSVTQASSASCHVLRVGQYLTHPREEGREVYPEGQPGDTEIMVCLQCQVTR